MNSIPHERSTSPYDLDGMPPLKVAIPLGWQQLLAMFVGNIAPAYLIAAAAGLGAADIALLLQCAGLFAGIATLIQLYPAKFGAFQTGAGLPVCMGLTYIFLPISMAMAKDFGLGALFGTLFVGSLVGLIVGPTLFFVRRFLPPAVTGAVILSVGISVFPVAIANLAGGMGSNNLGELHNWVIGGIVTVSSLIISGFGRGMWKSTAILLGTMCGFIAALVWGVVDFSAVGKADWFSLPRPFAFGFEVRWEYVIIFLLLYFINAVEIIGCQTVSAEGGLGRMPTKHEIAGGVFGNSVICVVGAAFNCTPTGTYAQCSSLVAMTKVTSRHVMAVAAITLVISSICPKIAAVLSAIPNCVIGGAMIIVFSNIAISGMRLLAKTRFTNRSVLVAGTSISLGLGLTFAKYTLEKAPALVKMMLGDNCVIVVAVCAIFLNLVLPKQAEDREAENPAQ